MRPGAYPSGFPLQLVNASASHSPTAQANNMIPCQLICLSVGSLSLGASALEIVQALMMSRSALAFSAL